VVRTVRVRLELDRNDYKQGLRDAAGDTRAFDAEVKAVGKDAEKTGVEMKQTATEAGRLGDNVKRSSRDVDGLGESVKKTGTELDKTRQKTTGLGDESTKTTTKVKSLDAQIRETRATVRQLGEEFLRTKDVDVFEKMRGAGGDLAGLQRAKKDLNELVGEFDKVGRKGGQAVEEGLADSFRDFQAESGVILPAAIAVAVTEGAPAIGAAVSAAVLLGVGGAGLATGIGLAFTDARVLNATHALGVTVENELKRSAIQSFADPITRATQVMYEDFNRISPVIDRIFAKLAPVTEKLGAGLGGFAVNIAPALERATSAAIPLLDRLAAELPRLGSAMGSFLDSMSRAGPGAERFFALLLQWIEGAIIGIGYLAEGLAKLFQIFTSSVGVLSIFGGALGTLLNSTHAFGDESASAFTKFGESSTLAGNTASYFKTNVSDAAEAVHRLTSSIQDYVGNALGLDQANLAASQSFIDLKESVKQHGKSLQDNTADGIANRQAIDASVQSFAAQRDAAIKAAGGENASAEAVQAANVKYNQQIDALAGTIRQLFGTGAAVEDLVGKYRTIPTEKSTVIEIVGIAQALGGLSSLGAYLNSLPSTKRISVVTTYYANNAIAPGLATAGNHIAQRWGGVYEKAATGLLREANTYSAVNPGRYMMAEPQTGGEAFVPKHGNYGRSMSILGKAASWYGASVVPARAVAGDSGGGTVSVELDGRVELTLDGRKVGELLINDAEHGGSAVTTWIRRVANR
jgi:hypothetical protein